MLSGLFKRFRRLQAHDEVVTPERTPDQDVAHYKLGNQLRDRGDLEGALAAYDRAIAANPKHAKALCNRGVVLQHLNRNEAALASFDGAIALDGLDVLSYYNRATVLLRLKRPEAALASYDAALAIKPDYLEAYCNRGNLLAELGRPEDALTSYGRSIELSPSFYHAYLGRGAVLLKRRQWDAALNDFAQAIGIQPDCAEAHSGRGFALTVLRRATDAMTSFSTAIALQPDLAEAYCGRGNLLMELKRDDEALASYDKAIALDPRYCNALQCRAEVLYLMKRFDEALASYELALACKPDAHFSRGMSLFLRMHLCDWRGFGSNLNALVEGIEAGNSMMSPFPALSLWDDPSLHLRVAETWTAEEFPTDPVLGPILKRAARAKIRVGYFSADYCDHPVAVLLAQLLESHDRTRFEIIAFSFGPDTRDAMRRRMEGAFDRFLDVRGQSDQEIALLARNLEIDIAVDLMGFTGGSRTRIFALRAAPIQVSYLGYPGTLGAPYMEYLIADRSVIPEAHQRHFTEKIVYLPGSYLLNDATRAVSDTVFTREALGLPPEGFVFCCFNNSYKIAPGTFDSWMRILQRVPRSVLWLSSANATAISNLLREAAERGIDPQRLIFAKRMPAAEEHLARHRAADLFLDTLPYNAHATSIDALWAGLPVLTLGGKAFAGRVGVSLLAAMDLSELVAETSAAYEELAVQLAAEPRRLGVIRQKLARNRLTAPLFDTASFTEHLERGYAEIMDKYWRDLPPDHVHVLNRAATGQSRSEDGQ